MRLRESAAFELEPIPPYSFKHTVSKNTKYGTDWYLFAPFEKYSNPVLWTGIRLRYEIPVGLKIESTGPINKPGIRVAVFSKNKINPYQVETIKELISRCLAVNVDILPFYDLANSYPFLKQIVQDLYGARVTLFADLFSAIILAVCLQMATGGRTRKMLDLIYKNYGEELNFDNRMILIHPTPKEFAKLNIEELKRECRLGYRASWLVENANMIVKKEFTALETLNRLSSHEAKMELMKLNGIGDYASEIISPHPSFPVDVWSVKFFSQLFGIKLTGKTHRDIALVKKYAQNQFGKWQSYVYDYVVNDLEKIKTFFLANHVLK